MASVVKDYEAEDLIDTEEKHFLAQVFFAMPGDRLRNERIDSLTPPDLRALFYAALRAVAEFERRRGDYVTIITSKVKGADDEREQNSEGNL